MTKNEILPLTGLRALAAFMVLCHHMPLSFSNPILNQFSQQMSSVMAAGVGVFFVLSGFLITYQYYDAAEFSGAWFRRYLVGRFARIYPVFLLVSVLWIWKSGYITLDRTQILPGISYFFLGHGLVGEWRYWGVSQAWTLTVECCFYLSAPFFFIMARQGKSLLLFPLLPLVGVLTVVLGMTNMPTLVLFSFFGRFPEFLFGVLLARLFLTRKWVFSRELISRFPWLTLAGAVGLPVLLYLLSYIPSSPSFAMSVGLEGSTQGILSYLGTIFNNLILPSATFLLIAGLLTERSWLSKLLGSDLMVLLGHSSYAFYLIQGFGLRFVPYQIPCRSVVVFLVVVIASVLVYKFYEHPMHQWLKKSLNKN